MKQNRFTSKFQNKSISELEFIASDKEDFEEDARLAAAWLLEEKSGSTVKANQIEEEIQIQKQKEIQRDKDHKESIKKNKFITDDPKAPELYSKRVITIFSVLFSSIFGAVLLIINLYKLKKQKAAIIVLGLGLVLTVLTAIAANSLKIGNIALVFNLVGAFIWTEGFWNKLIGKETLHRPKSWIIPAIISVVISAPILYFAIQGY